ncbi:MULTISPECIES: DUF418 domain-containing protein [unclassified Sphingomonas]|uniref:DUF418 domain-containing protein n=1 Tax=unclassified Sphingomonas TaxID=196159 RepID=UPI0006FFA335|nr:MULTISPECIES: DUF418 domain-containing protein [unclassified Sphingomonas]KQX20262.1 hypothetical protein ASD17_10375 [Sphingomonas sp. Root1294]KQY67512.1 hypothetical protein ASD39_10435 [Sphingomonas sp. Root50]KRB90889.1 hypothetical protein ASE22_11440 [Sphingomonas sp. Root720]
MSSPRPADPAQRLLSIDALRGVALCGILLINIFDMGGPIAMDRPLGEPSMADPDWLVWGVAQLFVTGTMRGLFSLLFGVGLLLFVGDEESADRSRLYLRRLVLLLLFGIVDSTVLLWPGDILVIYALAGIVALILHPLKPIQLVAAAAVILLMLSAWAGLEAPSFQPADTVYSPEMLAREGAARLGSYWQSFDYMSYVSWNWTVNALTYRWMGDALAFMLVGMALYRIGLFGPDFDERQLWRMVRIGYPAGLALRLLHALLVFDNGGGPTVISGIVDQPGRLAMTIGHVGLFLLLWRRGPWPRLMAGFARMGRMALTLYLGQSLIAAWIFSGFGLGLWNRLTWPALWVVAVVILAAQALFAALWFRAFRFGPVEWLWRLGTYGLRP